MRKAGLVAAMTMQAANLAQLPAGTVASAADALPVPAREDLPDVVADVCHDLRNALAALSHQVELLRDEPGAPETPRRLEVMVRTVQTAAGLLQRLDRAAPPPRATGATVDLRQVLADVADITRFRWDRAPGDPRPPIAVSVDLQPTPPVPGSTAELIQVFTNLVVNACEAMVEGGTLRLSTGFDGVHAVAAVTDDGPGMSQETRARLFHRHFSTKGAGNSGLGLAIVAEIIGRHSGHVIADAQPGRGTTFLVLLHPTAASREAALPA